MVDSQSNIETLNNKHGKELGHNKSLTRIINASKYFYIVETKNFFQNTAPNKGWWNNRKFSSTYTEPKRGLSKQLII